MDKPALSALTIDKYGLAQTNCKPALPHDSPGIGDATLRLRVLYSLLCLTMVLCMFGVGASAEAPLRNSFSSAEMKLMAETNLNYTACLQQDARENVTSSPDVRVVAGNAVQACEPLLTDLQARLNENEVNPGFYMGAITRMKNRAIRRLLPLLMMEKSNQAP